MDFTWIQTFIHLVTHLVITLLILVAPGAALYLGVLQLARERIGIRLTHVMLMGLGLSIAFWPLLLLYMSMLGLQFTALMPWGIGILSAAYVGYRIFAEQRTALLTPGNAIMIVSLGGMVLLAVVYRLGDVQGLAVPMFGDSLHHTLISTLIYRSGQVPIGYQPFVPVETFTYHFGFHTLAAMFAQMAAISVPQAVLFLGQMMNVAAVPLAYALNRWLFNSRLAGLGAALLTGFVSVMPAYYVNWGRYTQLTGHLLLIPTMVFLAKAMSRDWKRRDIAFCALCVGGLVVVHYRVLIFFGLFAVALATWHLINRRRDIRTLLASWSRGLLAIAIGFALTLPWLVNLAVNYFPGLASRLGSVTADYLAEYNNPGTILKYIGVLLPAMAVLGLIIGLSYIVAERRGRVAQGEEAGRAVQSAGFPPHAVCLVIALWTLLVIGSLWIRPGAIGSLTVAITLYIPLSVLGGYAIGWGCERVRAMLKVSPLVFAPLLLVAALLSAQASGTARVADPNSFSYLQPADQAAFQWINNNVPKSARFLISSQFSYVGRGVTASDAGMWLPLLTGNNVIPPALSAWMERPINPEFFTNTRKLAGYTQPIPDSNQTDQSNPTTLVSRYVASDVHTLADAEAMALMRGLDITHIYSGAYGGASRPRVDLVTLRRASDHYRLIYSKDGVYVFEVLY